MGRRGCCCCFWKLCLLWIKSTKQLITLVIYSSEELITHLRTRGWSLLYKGRNITPYGNGPNKQIMGQAWKCKGSRVQLSRLCGPKAQLPMWVALICKSKEFRMQNCPGSHTQTLLHYPVLRMPISWSTSEFQLVATCTITLHTPTGTWRTCVGSCSHTTLIQSSAEPSSRDIFFLWKALKLCRKKINCISEVHTKTGRLDRDKGWVQRFAWFCF